MKAGLITSVTLHAALLGFGLISLSAPSAFEVADVEALPVVIIPVESITQIQQGDKKAPMAEKPAPLPTSKPDVVPEAQKVGDNAVDLDTPPTPVEKPRPVKAAEAPPPSPEPAPKPAEEKKPEPVKLPEPKPEPVPATEVTPEPQPKQEVKPDPAPQTAVAETPEAESVKLPESAPSPESRPQPPQAQTAKAPDRKDAEKPAKKEAAKPKSEEKEFSADEVAALLNKEKAAGGGAKRSQDQAALGGDRTTGGSKLSQSEMDALRGQIQRCWNVPAGAMEAEGLKVSIQFRLDPSGAIEGSPEIISGGGSAGVERAAAESARRAVLQCAPYNLPADKYDVWADVIVHFDPSEMF
jgi:colicin import membrane protein